MKKTILLCFLFPLIAWALPTNITKDSGDLTQSFNIPAGKGITFGTTAGAQTIWIPGNALTPLTTNGATPAQVEITAGRPEIVAMDFDPSTPQFTQFCVAMPKSWNLGTVIVQFYWSHPSTSTNFTVVWSIAGVCVANGDLIATTYGTPVTVSDTGGTTNTVYVSNVTAAITLSNTPSDGDLTYFKIWRTAGSGGDNMAVAAHLLGVKLTYYSTAISDQ